MRNFVWRVLFITGATFASPLLHAEDYLQTTSLMVLALAPNAGGQMSFALRRGDDQREYSLFGNTYLQTQVGPLIGATYDWRFPLCGRNCLVQNFVQLGGGVSSAGPVAELLWGTIFLWSLRIDIATQLIATKSRLIGWSYPLWAGFSVPL